ncbi:nitroreductase family protein [Caballeronia insecticola]|uniref:Nitroreductase n=1 Tax=Caballeronia insecticola TaxID=758793 RepID=A0A060PH59_9BURK|nr:nitroreductase [Caballeronia insecticola]
MHSQTPVVDAVIRSRKAVRLFLPDAVAREEIVDILDVARSAPSNSNTQPWHVHVLGGSIKGQLSAALARAHVEDRHPPLQHFPSPLLGACQPRQEDFGARYYGALGINKEDAAARSRASGRNFDFSVHPLA